MKKWENAAVVELSLEMTENGKSQGVFEFKGAIYHKENANAAKTYHKSHSGEIDGNGVEVCCSVFGDELDS